MRGYDGINWCGGCTFDRGKVVIANVWNVFDFHLIGGFFTLVMKRNRVLKLLDEILVDGLSTLKDGPSIFEALNLFKNKARCVNLILDSAIDRNDTLLRIFFSLSVGQYFNLRPSRSFDNILDHVALLSDKLSDIICRD